MRTRIAVIAWLGLALVVSDGAWAKSGRSVLLLVADDLGRDDLSCYGHPLAKTPNLDRLARAGVRFTHAFATTASCSPSRSVLYTGLHNHANGQYGLSHAEHHFVQHAFVETIFTLLRGNGYRIGLIGKKHVLPESKYAADFEPRVNPRDVQRVGELAAKFFESAGDQPFLLIVGFTDPHRAAKGFGNERTYPGETPVAYDPSQVPVPHFLPEEPEVRAELAEYHQAVSRADQAVGRVLAALEAAGKQGETLVVFTSDNGMPFPGAKTTVYDPGLRMPLIVRHPTRAKRGVVNHALVSHVDLTPTLLEWTETTGPKYPLHGRSFLPILEEENPAGWEEVYASHTFHEVTMYYPMRAIRTRKFKFIWNLAAPLSFPPASDLFGSQTWQGVLRRKPTLYGSRPLQKYLYRDEFELYDVQKDPREIHNLANDPAYAQIRRDLAGKLRTFQEQTADPWAVRYKY
jgi:N-sulfoglucosamine sulfohydrolase